MSNAKLAARRESDDVKFKEPGENPEYDAWFRDQVQIGIDESDRGELIPHEEMQRWFAEQRNLLCGKIEEQK